MFRGASECSLDTEDFNFGYTKIENNKLTESNPGFDLSAEGFTANKISSFSVVQLKGFKCC